MDLQYSSLSIIFTFLVSAFLVLRIWKKSFFRSTSTLNLPPGPSKLPFIGSLHHLVLGGSLPHHVLRDLTKVYGPLMHLQLGEATNIIVSSPEIAKEMMKTHDVNFADRPSLFAAKIVTYNFRDIGFAPYGDYWRQLRKICSMELLSTKRVQSFRSIREEEVSKFVKSVSASAGSMISFSRMVNSLTYCIVSRAAVGKVWTGREEFIPVVKEIIKHLAGFSLADIYPSMKLLYQIIGLQRRIEKAREPLDKLLEIIINEHKAKYESVMTTADAEGEDHDLVDVLLNLQERGDLQFPLTIDGIKAIILDLFLAGTDSSSTSVNWAMSEMMKNPRILKKAQEEVREVFAGKGNVDEAGLHELNYLKSVIKETFRLHPPLPLLLPRESRAECKINGYDIPAHSQVMVNVWAIGRDPKYWNEPERFYPERFLDSLVDYKGTEFEFIPFGAGRRMCPGMSFGVVNMELPLAQALYHFDWKLPNGLNPENLDMSEVFGAVVERKDDLCLIPITHIPLPVD